MRDLDRRYPQSAPEMLTVEIIIVTYLVLTKPHLLIKRMALSGKPVLADLTLTKETVQT